MVLHFVSADKSIEASFTQPPKNSLPMLSTKLKSNNLNGLTPLLKLLLKNPLPIVLTLDFPLNSIPVVN